MPFYFYNNQEDPTAVNGTTNQSEGGGKDNTVEIYNNLRALAQALHEQQNKLEKNENFMFYAVIVLLVMVGTMIFSLQIAIWESRQVNYSSDYFKNATSSYSRVIKDTEIKNFKLPEPKRIPTVIFYR